LLGGREQPFTIGNIVNFGYSKSQTAFPHKTEDVEVCTSIHISKKISYAKIIRSIDKYIQFQSDSFKHHLHKYDNGNLYIPERTSCASLFWERCKSDSIVFHENENDDKKIRMLCGSYNIPAPVDCLLTLKETKGMDAVNNLLQKSEIVYLGFGVARGGWKEALGKCSLQLVSAFFS